MKNNKSDRLITWNYLYNNQIGNVVPANTSYSWCLGAFDHGLVGQLELMPKIHELEVPGFTLVAQTEYTTFDEFFKRLSVSQLAVDVEMREMNGQDSDDYFYYMFGQVPSLFDPEYRKSLRLVGSIYSALEPDNEVGKTLVRNAYIRIFGYGGLIDSEIRAMGSGIISSNEELTHFKLNKDKYLKDFSVSDLIIGDFSDDDFQTEYFIFSGYQQIMEFLLKIGSIASHFNNENQNTTWTEIEKKIHTMVIR